MALLMQWGEVCADVPTDPDAVVRELLDRSRLLKDVHVTVPLGLWRQYTAEGVAPGPPGARAPVGMIAEEAVYRLTVPADRTPQLSATVALRVFDPARCRNVPVLSAALAWQEVTVGGKAAKLATTGEWLRFTPDAPGRYVIAGRVPLKTVTRYGGSLDLLVPPTVRTLVELDSPDAWQVTASGAARRIVGSKDGGTHGRLGVLRCGHLSVRYEPAVAAAERAARYQVRGRVAWNLDAAGEQVTAKLNVAIMGGRTDRIDLSLPASAERVSVTGPDVREVQARGGAAAVHLKGRIAEQTRLAVAYEIPPAKADRKRFGPLAIRDGHWAGGTLVITNTAGGTEVLPGAMNGLRALALADIPPAASAILAGAPALAYEITSRTWSAEAEVVDLGEFVLRESIADLAHFQLALIDDGTTICKADYEIRNRSRQFVRLDLPRGSTVLLARVSEKSRPLSPIPGVPDAYLLPLVRSMPTVRGLVSFPVQVVFLYRHAGLKGAAEASMPLPRIDLPIAYAWCEAYVPGGMKVRRWSGVMSAVEQYSSATAVAQLGYGRGELAEGYKEKDRPRPADRPEPARPPKAKGRKPPRRGSAWLLAAKAARPKPAAAKAAPDGPTTRPAAKQPAPAKPKAQPPSAVMPSLARNHYRAGKESYDRGRYDEALKHFQQVIKLAPKSVEANNSIRLSSNIKLITGKLALRSQAEKAAGAQVKREIAEANRRLQDDQAQLLQVGFAAVREGRWEDAKTQFRAAESLGKKLIAQGMDAREQSALMRPAQQVLTEARSRELAQAAEVRRQVTLLRSRGDYERALQLAGRLRQYDVNGDARAEGGKLGEELEELAVLATRQRNVERQRQKLQADVARLRGQIAQLPGQAGGGETSFGRRPTERFARPFGSQDADDIASLSALGREVDVLQKRKKDLERRLPQEVPAVRGGPVRRHLEGTMVTAGTTTFAAGRFTPLAAGVDKKPPPPGHRPTGETPLARGWGGPPTRKATRTIIPIKDAKAAPVAAALSQALAPRRGERLAPGEQVSVVADPDSNSIIVTANQANLKKVRALLATLGAPRSAAGATVKKYVLAKAGASSIAAALNTTFASRGGIAGGGRGAPAAAGRIHVIPDRTSNSIIVSGTQKDHELVSGLLAQLDVTDAAAAREVRIIPLAHADPEKLAQSVRKLYGPRARAAREGARTPDQDMVIEANKETGTLIVTATGDTFDGIEKLVGELDRPDGDRKGTREEARQGRARELVALGNAAMDKSQPERAVGYFTRALAVDPDMAEARRGLGNARRLTAAADEGGVLSRLERKRGIGKQAGDVGFEKAMRRSREVLTPPYNAAKFDSAANAALAAQRVIEVRKTLYSAAEFQQKKAAVREQLKWVRLRREIWQKAKVSEQLSELRLQEAQRVRREPARTRQETEEDLQRIGWAISGMANRAEKLKGERKYGDALDIVERIRRLDPENRWAADEKEILNQLVRRQQEAAADVTWRDEAQEQLEAGAPGGGGGGAGPIVRQRLRQKIPTLSFVEIDLSDVVQFLRDVSDLKIDVNWAALRRAGIEKTTPVDVELQDVTFDKALRVVLDNAGGGKTQFRLGFGEDSISITTKDDVSAKTVTRVYDVRDLVTTLPVVDKSGSVTEAYQSAGERKKLANKLIEQIKMAIEPDTWRPVDGKGPAVQTTNGRLVVTDTVNNQRAVGDLIGRLRQARGPQVEVGSNIRGQRAKGLATTSGGFGGGTMGSLSQDYTRALLPATAGDLAVTTVVTVPLDGGTVLLGGQTDDGTLTVANQELRSFIARNYDWQVTAGTTTLGAGAATLGDGQAAAIQAGRDGGFSYGLLTEKLRYNLGQKVQVGSININADRSAAAALGVRFVAGANGVVCGVCDEAQFRTLMERDAQRTGRRVAPNPTRQETIVGTDALIANGWSPNLTFAGDRANTIDILDNPIVLPHEKYVLIDNGSFLTAVRAGEMQHWTQAAPRIEFTEAPQDIEVPRVGQLVKFEKALVKPTDQLVIRAAYTWKGTEE